MTDWSKPLNEYCERLGPELWSEPLNAVSNLSFIIAAIAAYHFGRRKQLHTGTSYLLVLILFAIGIGSSLYHTLANLWSIMADVLSIYLFQFLIVIFYGARLGQQLGKHSAFSALACLLVFIVLVALFIQLPGEWLNQSITYIPAWLSLFILGLFHRQYAPQAPNLLLKASAIFLLSLCFRSVDQAICSVLPIGSHFVWHLLNGYMLYLVIVSYMVMSPTAKSNDCMK